MAIITTKELTAIDDELSKEQNLIAKFKNYADTTSDTVIKNQYLAIAEKHQNHFNSLYNLLK